MLKKITFVECLTYSRFGSYLVEKLHFYGVLSDVTIFVMESEGSASEGSELLDSLHTKCLYYCYQEQLNQAEDLFFLL